MTRPFVCAEVNSSTSHQSEDIDFAERLDRVLEHVESNLRQRVDVSRNDNVLTAPMVTELLYTFDLPTLVDAVEAYAKHKAGVWILVDNLDKGWPAKGLTEDDARLVRCLSIALAKIERPLTKHDVMCRGMMFLRSDVFDLVVSETPDKNKLRRARLDLTNRDILREILRLRIAYSLGNDGITLESAWPTICVSHIGRTAEETSSFLVDRALMRPRCFLDLVSACRSNAITFQRPKMSEDDLREGLHAYSVELASNIGFELRDVSPRAPDVIFAFIGCERRVWRSRVEELLSGEGVADEEVVGLIELLLWYGVIGPVGKDGAARFIYDEQYEMRKLKSVHAHISAGGDAMYEINPAFWAALEIDDI